MLLSMTIVPGDHSHLVADNEGHKVAPWQIERAIRDAREAGEVDLPETFTFTNYGMTTPRDSSRAAMSGILAPRLRAVKDTA
jgi:hypothetical protein